MIGYLTAYRGTRLIGNLLIGTFIGNRQHVIVVLRTYILVYQYTIRTLGQKEKVDSWKSLPTCLDYLSFTVLQRSEE